jgi:hypothetical protein
MKENELRKKFMEEFKNAVREGYYKKKKELEEII